MRPETAEESAAFDLTLAARIENETRFVDTSAWTIGPYDDWAVTTRTRRNARNTILASL
jgi:hypothetical protein